MSLLLPLLEERELDLLETRLWREISQNNLIRESLAMF